MRKGKVPETRGTLIFQNKTGNDETTHDSKLKESTRPDSSIMNFNGGLG